MKVVNKNNGVVYDVFDVTYNKVGYPRFLIYKDGVWIRMSAKHFRPYTVEDWEKELADVRNELSRDYPDTTISFYNYDC